MKHEDVQVGQIWQRPDGRKVKLTEERMHRGSRELKLSPIESGRASWKWDGGVINDLTLVVNVDGSAV